MLRYFLQRLISAILVLIGVSILTFSMMHLLPGDPIQYMFALIQGPPPSPAQEQEYRHQLGFDKPVYIQYVDYVRDAAHGDLGRSIFLREPVTTILAENVSYTLYLTIAGLIIAIVFGVILGVIAAAKHGTWIDSVTMVISLVGLSMPYFWLAVLLVLVFSIKLAWFPATGQGSLSHLVLPAVAVGVTSAGTLTRLVRSSMLEVLHQEYVMTARAKGVREIRVLTRHVLRNAIIPAITIAGLQFGRLMGGAVITEIVFARKGLGTIIINAILNHDIKLVQGALLFIAVMFIFVNLLVDMLYAVIDPRIRYG